MKKLINNHCILKVSTEDDGERTNSEKKKSSSFRKSDPCATFPPFERWGQENIRAVNWSEVFSCSPKLDIFVLVQSEIQNLPFLSHCLWPSRAGSLYSVTAAVNSFCCSLLVWRLYHCCRGSPFIRVMNLIFVTKGLRRIQTWTPKSFYSSWPRLVSAFWVKGDACLRLS